MKDQERPMGFTADTKFTLPSKVEAARVLALLGEARSGSRRLDDMIHDAFDLSESFAKDLTTNLDHAMDLAELVLPNWSLDMQANRDSDAWARENIGGPGPFLYASFSMPRGGQSYKPVSPPSSGSTRAIAVCAAIFAALASDVAIHPSRDGEA
jgi:hypothetical protein